MNVYKISILLFLINKNAKNEVLALTSKNIKEYMDKKDNNVISNITFSRYIRDLVNEKYICEGIKSGRYKKYFISEEGINYIDTMFSSYFPKKE